jgi:hypothetical protein
MLPVPMAMVPVIWKVIVFPRGANRLAVATTILWTGSVDLGSQLGNPPFVLHTLPTVAPWGDIV